VNSSTLHRPELDSFTAGDVVAHLALEPMHARFRELLDEFHACDDRHCAAALADLRTHLVRQCQAEEGWMRLAEHPGLERHKYEQDFWLDVVAEVQERVAHGDVTIARWLAVELSHWFEVHTRATDSALVDFLQTRRDARCVLGESGFISQRAAPPRQRQHGG
jgi:hemerythrin